MQDRYKIYPEIHFGVSKLASGIKSIQELLELAEKFRMDKEFPSVRYQLNDIRNCKFDFNIDQITKMTSLVEKYKNIDNQQVGVYLVDQPLETAYVNIFSKALGDRREFCSTVAKAYDLLKLPVSFKEFQELIAI